MIMILVKADFVSANCHAGFPLFVQILMKLGKHTAEAQSFTLAIAHNVFYIARQETIGKWEELAR